MLEIVNDFMVALPAAGLGGLWDTILKNWIGPAFIAAIAWFAFTFIKDRAWMKLLGFIGIAAVVSVLVFAGDSLFGADGSLKNVAEEQAGQINTVSMWTGSLR